ncbi:hypothetical protein [Rhodoferax sp. WC2427]|uniref:hypothetical protein n=1 Tax=Rhodoferax sp. WC2427 TaxID=3234144 RepID=UPI0034679BF4
MDKVERATVHTEPPFALPTHGGVYARQGDGVVAVEGGQVTLAIVAAEPATLGDEHEEQA